MDATHERAIVITRVLDAPRERAFKAFTDPAHFAGWWGPNGFMRPFASTSTAEFTFAPDGERTVVTWSMSGEKNLLAKALHLVMDMDKMIGARFDEGLAQMRAVVEAAART